MSDELKKQRIIGIRHTLKTIKGAGLISESVMYPSEAVQELQKTKSKAENAKRHRSARFDAPVDSIVKKIEKAFDLPTGSVKLQYPSGKKARSDTNIFALRKKWDSIN